jgi:hypothetical protein
MIGKVTKWVIKYRKMGVLIAQKWLFIDFSFVLLNMMYFEINKGNSL